MNGTQNEFQTLFRIITVSDLLIPSNPPENKFSGLEEIELIVKGYVYFDNNGAGKNSLVGTLSGIYLELIVGN